MNKDRSRTALEHTMAKIAHFFSVLSLSVLTLVFALTCTRTLAQGPVTGEQFTGTISNPVNLNQYTITISGTQPPYTPGSDFDENAYVGPTTTGTFELQYTDLGGNSHVVQYPVQINNVTQEMTVQILGHTLPVSDLRDVFQLLPAAPGPAPATLSISVIYPITIQLAAVALAVPPHYATDAAVGMDTVIVFDRGRPAAVADLTVAQANMDIGAALVAKITQTAAPTWSYDCHGWTFTNGAKWINNNQVQKILTDNGYAQRVGATVQVGDVAVYKVMGSIVHTGVVTMVMAGAATQIESKWGGLGRYTHAPTDVPASYGNTITYWSSARAGGNLLQLKP